MKKIVTFFCFLNSMEAGFGQSIDIDALLPKITTEQNDDIRFEIIVNFFSNTSESYPVLDLKNAQKLLIYSLKNKDKIAEALATAQIGISYRAFGNTEKSLDYLLKANELAYESKNEKSIASINQSLGNVYKDLADYPKAISYFKITEQIGEKLKYEKAQAWAFGNLADVYLAMNKLDTALMYSQREYEICLRLHYYDFIGYTYYTLGALHGKLGNTALATSYYDMAIKEGIKTNSPKQLNWAYTSKAQYLNEINQKDSSIVYSKKAIAIVRNTPFTNYSIKPAKLLLELYINNNSDSALKYSEVYRIANDSLFSAKIIQQTQMMTFENELRQQKIAQEKMKADDQRIQNMQYALIALGIIAFIILFFLLSHSIIVTEKWISFFGVLGLLVVFEFVNLLIHPSLASVTHESPVLMLLALVAIASLLIPLHHRLEKWIKEKMTMKNKKIRLENAKRTIEQLEEK